LLIFFFFFASSIDAVVPEFRCGRTNKQHRNSKNSTVVVKSSTDNDITEETATEPSANKASVPTIKPKSRKSLVPTEVIEPASPEERNPVKQQTNSETKNATTAELDIQLRELMREKEIVSAFLFVSKVSN
jgi:hypothetical protein